MKSRKIKDGERQPCLFCGQPMKRGWDECTPFPYCDCPDAIKVDKINEEIAKLKQQMPRYKYKVVKKEFVEEVKPE